MIKMEKQSHELFLSDWHVSVNILKTHLLSSPTVLFVMKKKRMKIKGKRHSTHSCFDQGSEAKQKKNILPFQNRTRDLPIAPLFLVIQEATSITVGRDEPTTPRGVVMMS